MNSKLVLENLPLPVVVVDLQLNKITFVNQSFTGLLNLSSADLLGKPSEFLDTFIADENGQSLMKKLFEFVDIAEEMVDVRSSNTVQNLMCRSRILIQDNLVLAICIFETVHSLTERMISNPSLLLTKNESHELRSWLNTIMGLSQVLSDEQEMEKIKSLTENILKAGEGILSVFEKREGKKEEARELLVPPRGAVDVVPLIRESIQEYVHLIIEKKIHLRFTTYQKSVALKIDGDVFKQSFCVFLELAIRATDTGEVRIDILEKYSESKSVAIIKIIDAGSGIKKSYLDLLSVLSKSSEKAELSGKDRVYADFIRAKTMIEQIDGKITIESQWGVGTSVSLIFPGQNSPVTDEKPDSDPGEIERVAEIAENIEFTPEVLLVDDDQLVYKVIKRYLTGRCNMDYAIDGRRALTATANKHYDIILLDINLGVGLTGLQVAKKLRQQQEYMKTPIVAITAYAMPGDKERALTMGCTYYQSKPFTKAELLSLFNRCLALIGVAGKS